LLFSTLLFPYIHSIQSNISSIHPLKDWTNASYSTTRCFGLRSIPRLYGLRQIQFTTATRFQVGFRRCRAGKTGANVLQRYQTVTRENLRFACGFEKKNLTFSQTYRKSRIHVNYFRFGSEQTPWSFQFQNMVSGNKSGWLN
jgi:hypothetical protein